MERTAIILDAEGQVRMTVQPDSESELDDPAFNPPGHVQVRMKRADYDAHPPAMLVDGRAHHHDLLKTLAPEVAKKRPDVAAKIEAKVAVVDLDLAVRAEAARPAAAEAALAEEFPADGIR